MIRQPNGDDFNYAHSGQPGAPQFEINAIVTDELLKVLDAVLCDGFNTKVVSSLVIESGTVVFTYSEPHGYALKQKIVVSGADDPVLNGEHRITELTASTITIRLISATVATGTISTKVAPFGWESIFGSSSSTRRAYRSLNLNSTRTVLYLDTDTAYKGYHSSSPAKRAQVNVCANMTTLGYQIGSYTSNLNGEAGASPNGSLFWYQERGLTKSEYASGASARGTWVIFGNSDYFYLFMETGTGSSRGKGALREMYMFGDMPSFGGDSDDFNCMFTAVYNKNDASNVNGTVFASLVDGVTTTGALRSGGFFIRNQFGTGDLERAAFTPSGVAVGFNSGSATSVPRASYPNPINQGVIAMPLYVLTPTSMRARAPRLYAIPQIVVGGAENNDLVIVDDILLVAVSAYPASPSSTLNGYFALDVGV